MKNNRLAIKYWAIAITVCVAVFISLASYKVLQIRSAMAFAESFPEHSETVKSSYTQPFTYRKKVSVIGEVKSPQSITLYSETPGRIVNVGFNSGDIVKEGQVLIQLDIGEEEALLDAAKARLGLAESIYRRNMSLYKTNAVSEEVFDTSRVELATVKADIERLKSIIRKKSITAPFDGRTGIHNFEEGLFLLDNILITNLLGKQDVLWIDFEVPQFYPALENGDEIEVSALRSADKSHAQQWLTAHILARSAQVNKENRSYKYRANISTSVFNAGVNAGVEVRLPVTDEKSIIAVPVTAVQQDHLGQYVYLLKDDETSNSYRAVRKKVNVIAKDNQMALISSGLEVNQLIASDGAFKLYPDLLVHSASEEQTISKADQDQSEDSGENEGQM